MQKTFNCWEIKSSTYDGFPKAWPKCGMANAPGAIVCEVIFASVVAGGCSVYGGDRTFTAVFTRINPCSTIYSHPDVPVGIAWVGGVMPNQYDTGFPIVAWDPGIDPRESNGGSCIYNKGNNTWSFNAGFKGIANNGQCLISIKLLGVA